jgi:Protein of unknown function (DUF3224)
VTSHLIRRLGVTAGTLLLVAGAPPTLADAPDGGHGSREIAFDSTVQIVGGDNACDPTDPVRCAGTFRTIRTYRGDLTGTAYVVGSAVLLGDGTYQGQAVVQFAGEVAGCGQGTLIMLEEGVLDPATGAAPGTWTIVAGRGTGDLAATSGGGTGGMPGTPGATGTIRCG